MNGYARNGVPFPIHFGLLDWGAGADIDHPIVLPADWEARVRGVVLAATETFAGAANTALHLGATAGGTDNFAIAIDAAGGDAFTALDVWSVMFRDAITIDSDVITNIGAPGNAVTSVSDVWLAKGSTTYLSAQGGTGTLTTGIANVTLLLELFQVGSSS